MKLYVLVLYLISFVSFSQQNLFGLVKSGAQTHLVEFDILNGGHINKLTFPLTFRDFLSLTYDCKQNMFYAIGNSYFDEPSKLIRINPTTWTYHDLGFIRVYGANGSLLAADVCQVEGLSFNSNDQKLYAALNFSCNNYYSNHVVVFNLEQSSSFAHATSVGQTQGNLQEFDMMTFVYQNAATEFLYGVDVIPQSNTAILQYMDLNSADPCNLNVVQSYENYQFFRDLTFNNQDGLLYSFSNIQGQLWLTSFVPHYLPNSSQINQVQSFTNLNFNQIRGLSFTCREFDSDESTNNIQPNQDQGIVQLIFPNPAENMVQFETNIDLSLISQIDVYDLSSKLVLRASETEILNKKVDLSVLGKGSYLLHFSLIDGRNQKLRIIKL